MAIKRLSDDDSAGGMQAGGSSSDSKKTKNSTPDGNSFFNPPAKTPSLKWDPRDLSHTCWYGYSGDPLANAKLEEKEMGSQLVKHVKVAAFDLDGVLVRPTKGKKFPSSTDPEDFEFIFRDTLKRIRQEAEEGAIVVIFSNQKQSDGHESKRFTTWKKKIAIISKRLQVPHYVFAALDDDRYRKPTTGMWEMFLERLHEKDAAIQPRLEDPDESKRSFFVGDAAGRPASNDGKRPRDHSDTDRKYAHNIGIKFLTPEMFFEDAEDEEHTISDLPTLHEEGHNEADPIWTPNDTPLVKPGGHPTEIVLFVGPPAAGKTTFFARHFRGDYDRVNQDTLRTKEKCLAAVEAALGRGRSCVVDNTNPGKDTRALYIIAKRHGVPIRAVYFAVSEERIAYNDLYRSRGTPHGQAARKALPMAAFQRYFDNLEEPTIDEGYEEEPKVVQWRFVGDETMRKRYLRHMV